MFSTFGFADAAKRENASSGWMLWGRNENVKNAALNEESSV